MQRDVVLRVLGMVGRRERRRASRVSVAWYSAVHATPEGGRPGGPCVGCSPDMWMWRHGLLEGRRPSATGWCAVPALSDPAGRPAPFPLAAWRGLAAQNGPDYTLEGPTNELMVALALLRGVVVRDLHVAPADIDQGWEMQSELLYAVARVGALRHLGMGGIRMSIAMMCTPEAVAAMFGQCRPTTVSFAQCAVGNDLFLQLRMLHWLTALDLSDNYLGQSSSACLGAVLLELPHLTDVQLAGCALSGDPDACVAVLDGLAGLNLDTLNLNDCGVGRFPDALARALTGNRRLSWLALRDNHIGAVEGGGAAPARAIGALDRLHILDLGRNPLGRSGIDVVDRLPDGLAALYLDSCGLATRSPDDAVVLAGSVSRMRGLRCLVLDRNGLGQWRGDVATLFSGLMIPERLGRLSLQSNRLGRHQTLGMVLGCVMGTEAAFVNLDGCGLGHDHRPPPYHIARFMHAATLPLPTGSLVCLDLDNNSIQTDGDVAVLARTLELSPRLRALRLAGNQLHGWERMWRLARATRHTPRLRDLTLMGCPLWDDLYAVTALVTGLGRALGRPVISGSTELHHVLAQGPAHRGGALPMVVGLSCQHC